MPKSSAARKFVLLVISLAIAIIAGYIAAYYTLPSLSWFTGLIKPELTPPVWIFQPVWTVLYIMMGLSLYRILTHGLKKKDAWLGLVFFVFQLALNITWSYLFFGLHSIFFGFICILALWAILLCTIIQLLRFSVSSAALLLPYLFWVTFVAFLNYLIMTLNPISYSLPF
ncbi:MAG TPA: TspO/MBR family protein [Methanoregula sp.]|nr:TspO/MBR family protein [Methanoregula sp.]